MAGSGQTQTVSRQDADPDLKNRHLSLLGDATDFLNRPNYGPYSGPLTAGLQPFQQAAQQFFGNSILGYNPGFNAPQFNPTQFDPFTHNREGNTGTYTGFQDATNSYNNHTGGNTGGNTGDGTGEGSGDDGNGDQEENENIYALKANPNTQAALVGTAPQSLGSVADSLQGLRGQFGSAEDMVNAGYSQAFANYITGNTPTGEAPGWGAFTPAERAIFNSPYSDPNAQTADQEGQDILERLGSLDPTRAPTNTTGAAADAPYDPYRVATQNNQNTQTLGGTTTQNTAQNTQGPQGFQGVGLGQIGTAANTAGGLLGYNAQQVGAPSFLDGNVSQYQDPYTTGVIGQLGQDVERQRQLAQQQVDSSATQAGAFGGDRHAILGAETNRGFADSFARQAAQLRSAGFADAAGRLEGDQNRQFSAGLANQQAGLDANTQRLQASGLLGSLGGQLQGATFNAGNVLNQLGAQNQAQAQAMIDAQRQQFYEARDLPIQGFNLRQGILQGLPASTQTTQSTPTNRGAGILGGALSGAGTIAGLSTAANPIGLGAVGLGALGGGLLGMF